MHGLMKNINNHKFVNHHRQIPKIVQGFKKKIKFSWCSLTSDINQYQKQLQEVNKPCDELPLAGIALTSLTPPPQKNAPNSSQHVLACVLHVDRSSYHSSVCARQTDCKVLCERLLPRYLEARFPLLGRKVRFFFSSLSWIILFFLRQVKKVVLRGKGWV